MCATSSNGQAASGEFSRANSPARVGRCDRSAQRSGRVPVLLITAQSLAECLERGGGSDRPFLTVFVNAPDEVLDIRLAECCGAVDHPKVEHQRAEDRRYRDAAGRVLENLDRDRSLVQLLAWWRRSPATA